MPRSPLPHPSQAPPRAGSGRAFAPLRAAAGLALAALLACGAPPAPVVTDALGLLDPGEREAVARHHRVLLRDHDIDYRVDVVGDAGDLLHYGVERFAALDVGSRSAAGRGLLLVLDPVQDAVRLEVGRTLEGVYPDVFVAYLQDEQMVPFFRRGRVADGILAATELVVARAQEAEARGAFGPDFRGGSAGGGAEGRSHLGEGPLPRRDGPDVAARDTPRGTLAAYLDAMAAGNARPDLDLYTRETRALLADRVMTPAQMDSVVRTQRRCGPGSVHVEAGGERAVVRHPAGARQCAPWLLAREDGRWRLDLAAAHRGLRFGARNAWHFLPGAEPPYAFAFRDWRIDARGFPHAE